MRSSAAVVLWMLAAAAAPDARAADAAAFRLNYEAYLGGFRILSVAVEARYDAASYAIEVAARTRGVISWFGNWHGRGVSRGAAAADAVRPAGFRADTNWRGEDRFVELRYGPGSSVAVSSHPPPENDNRDPVPPEETVNTIDALSAAVALIRSVNAAGRCVGEARVYDGRRRFDMRLGDAGHETIEKTDYSAFSGTALKCQVTIRRIGGFWKNVEHPEDGKPSYLWMGRMTDGGPYVPVRVAAETLLGTLVMHLSAAASPNGAN